MLPTAAEILHTAATRSTLARFSLRNMQSRLNVTCLAPLVVAIRTGKRLKRLRLALLQIKLCWWRLAPSSDGACLYSAEQTCSPNRSSTHARLAGSSWNIPLSKCLSTTLLSSSSNGLRKTFPVATVYPRSNLTFGMVCTLAFSKRPSRHHWIKLMIFTCVRRTSYRYVRIVHLETGDNTCLCTAFTIVWRVCDSDRTTQRVPCV